MQIVCPNCDTSYDVAATAFGPQGRMVRCVRCRETWLARADMPAAAMAGSDDAAALQDAAEAIAPVRETDAIAPEPDVLPEVESPPIAHDPASDMAGPDAPAGTVVDAPPAAKPAARRPLPRMRLARPRVSLTVAVGAMAGLCIALVIWRQDVVRALPQSAGFFEAIRLPVNLRQMSFKDVTITPETVNGSKIYLIEGTIAGTARTPMDIPRLRFVVTDARGQEIYAWNAVPEQTVLQPGAKVMFRSRLASPPDDARNVTVRFFNRRDMMAGRA